MTLYDLYQCSGIDTLRVLFYDFNSNYSLSYKEINESILNICDILTNFSANNSVVACLISPSVLLPSVILGILKASSAFAFLKTQNSLCALRNMQKYIHIQNLLIEDKFLKEINDICCCWKKKISKTIHNISFVLLQSSECSGEICFNSNFKYPKQHSSLNLAYVMQTSGTTGESKIVQVPHQCIVPNIIDLKSKFKINHEDVVLLSSPLTFDPSIIDIFLAITGGSTLVIVPDQVKSIPRKLAEIIIDSKITILQSTPSLISNLGDEFIQKSLLHKESNLKVLAFGGEICPTWCKLKKWTSKENKTLLFNLYGLTEVSCWATCYKIDLENETELITIPLGETLTDTVLEIDSTGEIHIGGCNRWCVINDEIHTDKNNLILRPTGDIAQKGENGAIYFARRKDDIVKYKGKKIFLQPIHKYLSNDAHVANHVIHFEHLSSKLFIFIVWTSEVLEDEDNIKQEVIISLRELCPSMPPVEVHAVSHIPLTSHGKSDYKKLLEFRNSKVYSRNLKVSSIESCELFISELWRKYTNQPSSMVCTNFILNGGNSISALQLSSDIKWKFQISAPELVENILNSTFQNVVISVKEHLSHNKDQCSKRSSSNLQIFCSPSKKLCSYVNNRGENCFKMISRQDCLIRCFCSKHYKVESEDKVQNSAQLKISLNMRCKFDLMKCIDASPCIMKVFTSKQIICFIGSHSGIFCCINVVEEKMEWKITLPDRIESSACISACGKCVFVGCYDHNLYCIDVNEGIILWKFLTGAEIKSSPCVSKQNVVYVGSHDKHLYAIEKNDKSGKLLWNNTISKGSLFSSPVLSEELKGICVASLDGILAFLNMDSGIILWSYDYGKPFFSSPRLFSKFIYLGCVDGCMLSFDFSGKLQSSYKTNGSIFSSPTCSSLHIPSIMFGCHDCNLYCINESNKLLWKFQCEYPIYATPFSFNLRNQDYVAVASTGGIVYILQQSNGEKISSYKCTGELFSSPIVVDDFLIIGCRDDSVYCFELQFQQ